MKHRKKSQTVRVYTDASYLDGRGYWAAVILRQGRDPVEASGKMKRMTETSALAELQAIANGLKTGEKASMISAGDVVYVHSDCRAALDYASGAITRMRQRAKPLRDACEVIEAWRIRVGVEIEWRHVKGHQPETSLDPHAVHNRRCDQLCRIERKGPPKVQPAKKARAERVAAERPNKARAAQAIRNRLLGVSNERPPT